MSLKKYNSDQIKEIEKYIKERGKNGKVDNELLWHEWIKKNSKKFREEHGCELSIV